MGKKLRAFLASAAMTVIGMGISSVSVSAAATYSGNYFGMGLDSYDSASMGASDGWSNGGMFDCTWRASNVSFSGGIMNLKIDRDYATGGYSGAEYRTQKAFGYGMYDVKMKPIRNDGVVTSFFTYTGPTDGTVWDEIDIEFLGKDTTKVQFNYYTNGVGNHEYLYNLGFDASKEFHQYGFYWEKGKITWYVDQKPVYCATSNIPSTPGKIMMNVWPGTGVNEWLNAYNGATPLVGQYDWASYTAPGTQSSSNSTTSGTNGNTTGNTSMNFSDSTIYTIISKNSGKALDVSWGSMENGANVLQYAYNGYSNQKWYVQKQANGYYLIRNYNSGKVLDVADYSAQNGANVQQWDYVGGPQQEWQIVYVNGAYKLINHMSGKALDVNAKSKEDNANVQQWIDNGQANQLWEIAPAR